MGHFNLVLGPNRLGCLFIRFTSFPARILPGSFVLAAVLQATPGPSAQLFNNVWAWYWTLGVASGAVTFGLFVYILYRYRSRPGRVLAPEKSREARETWKGPVVTFALMGIVLLAVGAQTFMALPTYQNPPKDQGLIKVGVIGQQFFWSFAYPDNKTVPCPCEVPVGTEIVLNVTSKDVNHQFGLPDFRVKTDAIPGKYNVVWIQPEQIGNYTIQCFELCGVGHATMISTLVVVPPSTYGAWLNSTVSA
jgi:cytochrome c oxidase subunit II